jgi:dihydrofolate reductase
MGKTMLGAAAVSLDGYIAREDDTVGPLFDWLVGGEVEWRLENSDFTGRSSRASADFMTGLYANAGAMIIGRRLFDLTNGWNGHPTAFDHVFVVTHRPANDWEHHGSAPFTFVGGVEEAFAAAREFAGDRDIDVTAGDMGGQALELGLIDRVVMNVVPVVLGSGRPFFGTATTPDAPRLLDDPATIVEGDRVTHLVYDVRRT